MNINYEYIEDITSDKWNVFVYLDPKDLTGKASQEAIDHLIKMDKGIIHYADFEQTSIYIKLESDLEKNRRLGAKVFNDYLKPKTSKVHFLGVFNNQFVEGLTLASYKFDQLKTKESDGEHTFVFDYQHKKELDNLKGVLTSVFWARDLVNLPYSHLNTRLLEEQIRDRFENSSVTVQFLNKSQLEEDKFGGVLAVNKASDTEPRFGILEYKPTSSTNKKPIVLVGKGIVYDTGGLSLKPTANSMDIMKCDMGGLATVVGTMDAINNASIDKWVICLIPITDNLIGNNAIAPGDVITMRSGKTVEVMNTDAEGRLVLADALDYAKQYDPQLVIDAATLTGSAVAAFGNYAAAIMGNASEQIFDKITKVGNVTGDRLARMPFWDDYAEEIKSPVADIKNIGGSTAGAITAGKFLEHFVGYEWLHVDIAGPGYLHKPMNYLTSGGTGYGVRLLTRFINELD